MLLQCPGHPVCADFKEISKTAERSADLTRQLLAFARKQTIAPKVLDLNETVSGMFKMLQRLIGEDINLNWRPAPNLWPVYMDPSQIDQIFANLCVNARDSITDVGKITIETGSSIIDEEYCSQNVICRRFKAGLENFETLYRQQVNAWMLYDNSGSKPKIVAWGEQ